MKIILQILFVFTLIIKINLNSCHDANNIDGGNTNSIEHFSSKNSEMNESTSIRTVTKSEVLTIENEIQTQTQAVEENIQNENIKNENIQNENIQNEITDFESKQHEIKDLPLKEESLIEKTTSTTTESTIISFEQDLTTKPCITVEDYAVKQMNFILERILLETQKFVAKVLQTTDSSALRRDSLKSYAENLYRILNSKTDDGVVVTDDKVLSQEELYERLIQKLNFLKSTTNLQALLSDNWHKDYENKRADISIWLDKASEPMRKEFNRYVTEENDYVKYLYFNEAFDDLSQAKETHQKLSILMDLIKIVLKKKQITFMDLYMQI